MNDKTEKRPEDNTDSEPTAAPAIEDTTPPATSEEPASDVSSESVEPVTDPEPEPETPSPRDSTPAATPEPKAKAKGRSVLWLAVLFALLLALAGGLILGWWMWRHAETEITAQAEALEEARLSIEALNQTVTSQRSQLSQLQEREANQSSRVDNLAGQVSPLSTQLSDLDQRVGAVSRRLRAMSDVSREDWLLAEAEYLLKLANQRVRIERSAEGAEALLEEADRILRDMDDPELHPLRRAIAKDLTALKLMNKIDVEGVYLSLVALADQVERLPLRPVLGTSEKALAENPGEESAETNTWAKLKGSFRRFLGSLKDYVKVTRHNDVPRIIAPKEAAYVQANLRLILERAQVALLREQADIYRTSLKEAADLVLRHYPATVPRQRFVDEVAALQEREIVQELPDIRQSLNLLHAFIRDLHLMKESGVIDSEEAPDNG